MKDNNNNNKKKNYMPLIFNFIIIYKIHKILILLKNHLNDLKDSIFKCFFKGCNRLLFRKNN